VLIIPLYVLINVHQTVKLKVPNTKGFALALKHGTSSH